MAEFVEAMKHLKTGKTIPRVLETFDRQRLGGLAWLFHTCWTQDSRPGGGYR